MLFLDQTAERLKAARQALQFHAAAKGRGGGIVAPKPSEAILLGLFTLRSKRTYVSLYLPTLRKVQPPPHQPFICIYAAHV